MKLANKKCRGTSKKLKETFSSKLEVSKGARDKSKKGNWMHAIR